MEILWAPWRMAYITGPREGGCILCEKAATTDDRASLVLARGRWTYVLMNLYPYNTGHLLIAPYRHLSRLADCSPDELLDLMRWTQRSEILLREELRADGFNIGVNLGKVAGAGMADHLHLHVVPRWNGDTNFMPVTAETKVMPEQLADTYARLLPRFAAASREEGR
jgi:ATP adenylyltransferase